MYDVFEDDRTEEKKRNGCKQVASSLPLQDFTPLYTDCSGSNSDSSSNSSSSNTSSKERKRLYILRRVERGGEGGGSHERAA